MERDRERQRDKERQRNRERECKSASEMALKAKLMRGEPVRAVFRRKSSSPNSLFNSIELFLKSQKTFFA